MFNALKNNWRVYFCEALGLGVFMVSACVFSAALFHPESVAASLNPPLRFVLTGAAMGATAVLIFLSPFGRLSGAHINPAVTLAFWRLGKIDLRDAVFYVLFQFLGASAGVFAAWLVLGDRLAEKNVNFAVTAPNAYGALAALTAEFIISFGMMLTVLITSNHIKLSRFTPYFAGLLVAVYIALEAPVSGMSMNPARTFGSAVVANQWDSIWIYFVAPPLAMLAAAEVFRRAKGFEGVYCAKIYHRGEMRCIFKCRFGELGKPPEIIEVTKEKHLFPTVTQLF